MKGYVMKQLEFETYGMVELIEGLLPSCNTPVLPLADAYNASGVWGELCLQEINSQGFSIRHFQVRPKTSFSFNADSEAGGIYALVNLKGSLDHKLGDAERVTVAEKEFVVFKSGGKDTLIGFDTLKPCTFVSLHYYEAFYSRFSYLLERFKELLKDFVKPFYFFDHSKIARHTVHDDIQAIWEEKYMPALIEKHIELRIELVFFSLVAATPPPVLLPGSRYEREKAAAAKELILKNIKEHLTPKEIASELNCSPEFLIKAFKNVYQMGMFHFLRRTRMERAKEMLLSGSSLKEASITVGMNPSNFPKEFKKFFGYTVTYLIENRP